MKNSKVLFLFLVIGNLGFSSCERWKCVKGDNHLVQESRSASGFSGIISEGDFAVYIIQDTLGYSVTLDGDQNALSYISTEVDGSNNLVIKKNTRKCIRTDKPIQVYINVPDLSSVELSGSGLLQIDRLNTSRLRAILSGSGTLNLFNVDCDYIYGELLGSGLIEMQGYTTQSDLIVSGSGNIRAYDLEQSGCYATISGSGQIIVWAWNLLDALISGSGTISYRTRPIELKHKVTGTGEVKPF